METSSNSTLLNMKTKRSDKVICVRCGKGIYIPFNESAEINHSFKCNNCGQQVHMDPVVVID